MFEINGLRKVYPSGGGIQRLDLTVRPGEVVGLLGPNGAGKTTALQAVAGWVMTDAGEVSLDGASVQTSPHLTKQYIGMMIGEPTPYPYVTGYEYLKLYCKLYTDISEERIQQTLELVGMAKHQKQKIKSYSTGMKQRIALASALLHQPRLLLLDEPFSGMDIEGRREIATMLSKLVTETGMSVIVSSHQVHDIESWMTDACIIFEGRQLDTVSAKHIRASYSGVEDYYLSRIEMERSKSL